MQLVGLDINPNKALTDNEKIVIEDKVSNYLQINGFDEEYKPTREGLMCESILDLLV